MHPTGSEAGDHAQLARDFDEHLREGYRYLVRTINYRAKAFNEMLTMYGGVRTAQLLLQGPRTSDGFARLWQENMLQHSVEASVLRPKYRPLFTDAEQEAAQRRLEDHEFDVEGFLGQVGEPESKD